MLVGERRDLLLGRLRRDGRIIAKDLAHELGLSEDSVRRDLRDLAAAGLCQRVYGGALPASPAAGDYSARQGIEIDSKLRIATRAAAMVRPGATVILDGGTTALAVARALPQDLKALVITHSPTVAAALASHPSVEIFLIGGRIFKHSVVACGAAAVEATEGLSADLFFLGVTGVHPRTGLTTGDADEAAMKRALSRRAADTYVLASVEKIGAASPFAVLPLDAVAGVITDGTGLIVQELADAGVAIVTA